MSLRGPPPGWGYAQAVALVFVVIQWRELWALPEQADPTQALNWWGGIIRAGSSRTHVGAGAACDRDSRHLQAGCPEWSAAFERRF
jgi:hypothetical protein